MNRPARLLCLALCLSTLPAPAATAQTAPAAQPKSPAAKKPAAKKTTLKIAAAKR